MKHVSEWPLCGWCVHRPPKPALHGNKETPMCSSCFLEYMGRYHPRQEEIAAWIDGLTNSTDPSSCSSDATEH